MLKYLNKGISTPIAIGIILILFVLGSVTVYWQYSDMQKENIVGGEISIPEKEKVVEDKTADWKIHKSSKMAFSIKSPANLKTSFDTPILDVPSRADYFVATLFTEQKIEPKQGIKKDLMFIEIESWEEFSPVYGEGFTFKDFIDEEIVFFKSRWDSQLKEEDFVLDGNPAVKTSHVKYPILDSSYKQIVIMIYIQKERMYKINAWIDFEAQDTYLPIFNQILSTFKFIEDDKFAGWATHKNEEYEFQIKYPEDLLLSPPLRISSVEYTSSTSKYLGVRLGEFNNGCSLNIFRTDRDENINPFDETDIPVKMKRYAVSEKIEVGDKAYHFAMSVASHAVDPNACKSLLDEMLSTFKFLD